MSVVQGVIRDKFHGPPPMTDVGFGELRAGELGVRIAMQAGELHVGALAQFAHDVDRTLACTQGVHPQRQHAAEQQAKTGQVKHLTMMGHASDPQ